MSIINTLDEFNAIKNRLILFTGEQCQPCKTVKAFIDQNNIQNIYMVDVDVDVDVDEGEGQKIAMQYQVRSLPTMIEMVNGSVSQIRYGSKDVIELIRSKT